MVCKPNFYWIFYKIATNKYIITSDDEMQNGELADLLDEGYEIVWDSALSKAMAKEKAVEQIDTFLEWYQKDYPLDSLRIEQPQPLKLQTIPISLKQAQSFIKDYHRHNLPPSGHKFSVGLWDGETLVGVVIAGLPIARNNNDGFTIEVTRCCMRNRIYKNGVTKLLSAVYQAAKALGYRKIVTYTLQHENGHSLKACGFHLEGISKGGSWNCKSRRRVDKASTEPKKNGLKKSVKKIGVSENVFGVFKFTIIMDISDSNNCIICCDKGDPFRHWHGIKSYCNRYCDCTNL